ncbi:MULTISPECIES: hypothetical protein [Roseobacteraceae]|uniref:hypothetical protein n=1 Tax=Roseobacteraceae TaxID=2854170 RepID=UPI0020372179|nr:MULTISPECIES: hypothetical protein [Roseobacteraceae]
MIRPRLFRLDEQYRFLIEIVHPQNRELIWSEMVEDPHSDWAGKVRVILLNIGNALRVVFAERQGKDDRAALYVRWLQSLALKGTWTEEDEARAVALLRCIKQEAPDFGPAHAELAGIYRLRLVTRNPSSTRMLSISLKISSGSRGFQLSVSNDTSSE